MASFIPRTVFPTLESLTRSYFLGHHQSGLNKMKTVLSNIDLVIECRDYRVPLTSRNPLFEETLGGRERLLVYTKQDLGSRGQQSDKERENVLRQWHMPNAVLFSDHKDNSSVRKILRFARDRATAIDSLTGACMMVVGMPNVGKSSLLNALRQMGVHKGKAASTGAQPGVTRKIGTTVKILEGTETGAGLYLLDTPGVFIPYVPNSESMLKLALCGSVKDTIIPPTILADYLLYHLNLHNPGVYSVYCRPTNNIEDFLTAVAERTGRLKKGGMPDTEASALWVIQRWRHGHLGQFVLDEVTISSMEADRRNVNGLGGSLSQARKADKVSRMQRSQQRHFHAS